MPYTGGRVDFASRTSSPDESRGAYAKWYLRTAKLSESSDGIRKELSRKGRSGDRDWARGNILCHTGLKARFDQVQVQPGLGHLYLCVKEAAGETQHLTPAEKVIGSVRMTSREAILTVFEYYKAKSPRKTPPSLRSHSLQQRQRHSR
jgi:hypothetical protein